MTAWAGDDTMPAVSGDWVLMDGKYPFWVHVNDHHEADAAPVRPE